MIAAAVSHGGCGVAVGGLGGGGRSRSRRFSVGAADLVEVADGGAVSGLARHDQAHLVVLLQREERQGGSSLVTKSLAICGQITQGGQVNQSVKFIVNPM